MKRDTGSLRRIFPSSTSIITAAPVIGFDIEASRKMPSFGIGFFDSMSISPCASKWAMRPLRATSVTTPDTSFASTWRCIASCTRCRRSDESPTSSGFDAVGTSAIVTGTARVATATNRIRFQPSRVSRPVM